VNPFIVHLEIIY